MPGKTVARRHLGSREKIVTTLGVGLAFGCLLVPSVAALVMGGASLGLLTGLILLGRRG